MAACSSGLKRGLEGVEERDDVGRDEKLRVGERVHQEHFAAIRERDADIEHGRLHIRPLSFYWRNGCAPAVQGPFPGLIRRICDSKNSTVARIAPSKELLGNAARNFRDYLLTTA
jgi:hypothetical protein